MNQAISTVLGIESSCDETAAAVVRGSAAVSSGEILATIVLGQEELHARFGGVVPEIAARAHAERLDIAIDAAMKQAGVSFTDLDGVAATAGPGLIGGVAAGVAAGQAIAISTGLPFIAVNHLEGHALTPRLSDGLAFPYLLLLASGGHCQLIEVEALGAYRRLGGSIDDSPGEAFDKLAKHLGLGFPGGPAVEKQALNGDPRRFELPRPLADRPGADMSFSGLKTAARLASDALIAQQGGLSQQDVADLCASFQTAICDVLALKTNRAAKMTKSPLQRFTVAGGVAANKQLRAALQAIADQNNASFSAPPLNLCTDNGAMIAWAGLERLQSGLTDDPTQTRARPRWPLDSSAEPLLGSGKKGAKA